ncbi:MAG: T9SS type A sorting domain-containing protein, partial [Saprospiraceae bacterium]
LNVILPNKSNFEFINLSGQILIKGVFNDGNNTLALNQNITNGLYFLKINDLGFKVIIER